MKRQIFVFTFSILILGCAGKKTAPEATVLAIEDAVSSDAVTLESVSARKVSSDSCAIPLISEFYFDPTFLNDRSTFEFIGKDNRIFASMERTGYEQSSKFTIKNIHNGRILGTAVHNGRTPKAALFDCENFIYGSVQEHREKGRTVLIASNAKKIVQFVSTSIDKHPAQVVFKTTDGKDVFSATRETSDSGREKWKIQILNNQVDPKFVIFTLGYFTYQDDKHRVD